MHTGLGNNGKWITSSFYMESLPDYIQEINDRNDVEILNRRLAAIKEKFAHNLEAI